MKHFLSDTISNHIQNKILKAIAIQHNDTYGLLRSPILANFQNVPKGLKIKIKHLNSIIIKQKLIFFIINVIIKNINIFYKI